MASHLSNMFGQIGHYTKTNLCSNGIKNKDKQKQVDNEQKVVVVSKGPAVEDVRGAMCPMLNGGMPGPVVVKKPLKLKNVSSQAESYDALHNAAATETTCSTKVCMGSVMMPTFGSAELRSTEEVLRQAKNFLDEYYTSIRRSGSATHSARWAQVQSQVLTEGTYQLTETELTFGAKLAWRNAVRCIGRIQWSKLQVFDCRYVTTTSGMFEAICNHIKYGTNKGNIRSAITIFPQRTDGLHDYRIWNPQLVSYAGYRNPDGVVIGDAMNVEFTDVCTKLGWKGARTQWDILPVVLSAGGHDPDYFEYPPDLVMEVPITHPTLDWFADLDLRWYVLPAVSGMLFDCGGLEFTASGFNGWYMSTEIACRNLCDVARRNMLEPVALRMGLNTRTSVTLWKDRALVEVNAAVLHSFQQAGVTIVDHHTASESFIKHCENEQRLRSGCPADWVWIVPPMSGSVTQVFHQEMALYYLKPSYEYQEAAWRIHVWQKGREGKSKKPSRKFHFKQIARAVKFTSKLFGHALSRRIKATVLYATETGRAEMYAKKLGEIFGHAFNAQVHCMDEYDISNIEHEGLVLVVTSTFGNGDPPENGESFAQNLYGLKMTESENGDDRLSASMATSKSFIKAHSRSEVLRRNSRPSGKRLDRLESFRGSQADGNEDTFGPLSNVRFAVFALGSSAYPHFCAFGGYVDNLLGELGGERLMRMGCGDEMCGQEQAFRKWAPEVFNVACETFCLDDDDTFLEATMTLQTDTLTVDTVRFVEAPQEPLLSSLRRYHNKKVVPCMLLRKTNLHADTASGVTMLLEIDTSGDVQGELGYEPGDHVGVFCENRPELVNGLIERLQGADQPDKIHEIQVLKENHTFNGVVRTWTAHDRLPACSLRMLLSRFLDITTPASPALLQYLSSCADDEKDRKQLQTLATDSSTYEDWRHSRFPHLLEVLMEFPSCRPHAALLCAQLTPLQARFYSISSAPAANPGQLHLTVAVVRYRTMDGTGPEHFGVCSNYLHNMSAGDNIYLFSRSAPSFHLPADPSRPVVLIGPGTGIAPFRGFWQHLQVRHVQGGARPKVWLFFGCRTRGLDLYAEEKARRVEEGVLDRVFLALSREPGLKKTYVQDLAVSESKQLYNLLVKQQGHLYVCGDVTMAECVHQVIRGIFADVGGLEKDELERTMLAMRDENRYHEDIFGITLRTAEVHNRSRETARSRLATE